MMTSINKILYATDLDTGMRSALGMAMSLADKYQAQVTCLYVIEPVHPSVYHWESEDFWQEIQEKTEQASVKLSEEYVSRFFEEEKLGENVARPQIVIKHGHIADTILRTADDVDADLIILGTHHHTALGKLILGSVADKVMRSSSRPVLLVPTTD